MLITASHYHRLTSYDRHRMSGHSLDWANQPSVYKTYDQIETVNLPENPPWPEAFLSHILKDPTLGKTHFPLSKEDLSQILLLTSSLTAKALSNDGPFYYRSVASAGALYPTELYLHTTGLPDVKEGLYHYSIAPPGLVPLREGNFSFFLQQTGQWAKGVYPGLSFIFSAIIFRSAWKYRDRAFRYHLLDTGHLLENLLLVLRSRHLPVSLTYDFDDQALNRFLGLDQTLENVLVLVTIPEASSENKKEALNIPDLADHIKRACRVAREERPYPLIQTIVEQGQEIYLEKTPPGPPPDPLPAQPGGWEPVMAPHGWPEKISYAEAVFTRRSKRNFIPKPLPSGTFRSILEGLSVELPGTSEQPERANAFFSLGLLTEKVEGFRPGLYALHRKTQQIGLVKEGHFLKPMARVCLEQMWLANAAFHLLFLSDIEALEQVWGPRGYRYALLSAGRLGERLYILSAGLGLGCCGIGAFYDQEAADLLGLDGANRLLYLVSVGITKQ